MKFYTWHCALSLWRSPALLFQSKIPPRSNNLFMGWYVPVSNMLVILSELANTLASVARWGRLSHMITVQLGEVNSSFTYCCVCVSSPVYKISTRWGPFFTLPLFATMPQCAIWACTFWTITMARCGKNSHLPSLLTPSPVWRVQSFTTSLTPQFADIFSHWVSC